MATTPKQADRRANKTRQQLRKGFVEAMREKGFASMSVQDIADRADVNRGTFYIHYRDKFMILDEIVRDNFRMAMSEALSPEARWDPPTLRIIAMTVLTCFEGKYKHRQPSVRFPAAPLEQAIREELTVMLASVMKRSGENRPGPQLEARALAAAWAMFGTAIQWSQEPAALELGEMADAIVEVVTGEI